ncbi:MAG: hypothetical protein LE168_05085 [Endomicrobium sp.]|nr:hypothetical protein [Endomicrobium sp.]
MVFITISSLKTKRIDIKTKTITCSDGKSYKYGKIVSTQPLPELINQITNVSLDVKTAAKRPLANNAQWIYSRS